MIIDPKVAAPEEEVFLHVIDMAYEQNRMKLYIYTHIYMNIS